MATEDPIASQANYILFDASVKGECRIVLPQFIIVVIAIKSVYLNKKWRLPLRKKGASPTIIITISGYAKFVGLRAYGS